MVADLTAARATAESLFDCQGTVTRDVEATTDDNFNLATGVSGKPAGDDATIYDGPMWVRPASTVASRRAEAGQQIGEPTWRARIPVSAARVKDGDVLTVTAAPAEYDLQGRVFTVEIPQGGSLAVTRMLQLLERTRGART